jgi:phage terminase large subunit-like protein
MMHIPDDWRQWSDPDKARLAWVLTARPNQLTPLGDWNVWLLLAGRGFGKTRSGAEDIADFMMRNPGVRVAVVAPTIGDTRDTCFEGESGLLNCLPPSQVHKWNRSMSELHLTNGSLARGYSSEEPERLRGPQFHRSWCEELCAWKYDRETWDQLQFGLRLKPPNGGNPQCIITTTPKPTKLLKEILKRKDITITKGSTFENADNLSPAALEQLKLRYANTRLGRQELEAELLDDVEGALWTHEMIDADRVVVGPDYQLQDIFKAFDILRMVVAVDPAVTANADSDMTGIVVVGRGANGHAYVFADRSAVATPGIWAQRVLDCYYRYQADMIVAEVNQGHDLVKDNILNYDARVHVKKAHAKRGKILRAEPVSALYEQHRVHHVGEFTELEDQMCEFTAEMTDSPDRLDALVYGLTELMLGNREASTHNVMKDRRLVGRR